MGQNVLLQLYLIANYLLAGCAVIPCFIIAGVACYSDKRQKKADSRCCGRLHNSKCPLRDDRFLKTKYPSHSRPWSVWFVILLGIIIIWALPLLFYGMDGQTNIRMAVPFMLWPVFMFILAVFFVSKPWCLGWRDEKTILARMIKMKYVVGWLILFLVTIIAVTSSAALSTNPISEYVPEFYRPFVEPTAPFFNVILAFFGKEGDSVSFVIFVSFLAVSISTLLSQRVGSCFPSCNSIPVGTEFGDFSKWILSLVYKCVQVITVPLLIIYAIVKLNLQNNWALAAFMGSAIIVVGIVELVVALLLVDFVSWFGWAPFPLGKKADDDIKTNA